MSIEHADDTEDRECKPSDQKIASTLGNSSPHWMDPRVKSNPERYPLDFCEITVDNSNPRYLPLLTFHFILICFSSFNHYTLGLSAVKFSLHVSFMKPCCYNPSVVFTIKLYFSLSFSHKQYHHPPPPLAYHDITVGYNWQLFNWKVTRSFVGVTFSSFDFRAV